MRDTTADALVLHEDRFFDPEPSVRRLARALAYDLARETYKLDGGVATWS